DLGDVVPGGVDDLLGGRVGPVVALGEAHAADVEGAPGDDLVGAADHLGGAAPDVDDEVGTIEAGLLQAAGGAGEAQRRLLVAGDDLRGDLQLPEGRANALEELLGIARVPGRRGGHEPEDRKSTRMNSSH